MAAGPVVVAVDGSDEALRALEWAAREAERHSSLLRIVSAPAMPPRMRAREGPEPTVSTELREHAVRAVEAAAARSREIVPGLVTETRLLSGPPAVAIADAGESALMVVVGARGGGGFAALLLGSVSRYVAMQASCPVIVVREQTDMVQREIVIGVRDPHESTGALMFAFEEAALWGAELVVMRSGQVSAEDSGNLWEALGGWRDKYPAVTVRPDVVHGHPAQVLAEYSARADLVVLGRRAGSRARPAVGSIQHAVLNHARGPVAIVPEG
jgi:nucleotide-binding universal stress UspA family protein